MPLLPFLLMAQDITATPPPHTMATAAHDAGQSNPAQDQPLYFPPDVGLKPGAQARYSDILRAMSEPALYGSAPIASPDAFALRILFLPSFHVPYAVSIDARGSRPFTRMTQLDPGLQRVNATYRRLLSLSAVRRLASNIRAHRLADMPPEPVSDDPDTLIVCADGMAMVVELVDQTGFHAFTLRCGYNQVLHDMLFDAAGIGAPVPDFILRYR